jgi:hypothetical protein
MLLDDNNAFNQLYTARHVSTRRFCYLLLLECIALLFYVAVCYVFIGWALDHRPWGWRVMHSVGAWAAWNGLKKIWLIGLSLLMVVARE